MLLIHTHDQQAKAIATGPASAIMSAWITNGNLVAAFGTSGDTDGLMVEP